jgi:hypothetical protein
VGSLVVGGRVAWTVAANTTSRVGVGAGTAAVAGGPWAAWAWAAGAWAVGAWTDGTTGPETGACGWTFFLLPFISSIAWTSWIIVSECRGLTAYDHF